MSGKTFRRSKKPFARMAITLAVSSLTLAVQADDRVIDPATALSPMEKGLPEVLTATRLRQGKADTPATVTILEGDLIRELGLLNLWEVFRLVPGMTVGFVESNVPVVSYHGTAANEQRRLQVLVDGRSYYNASLADVTWHAIPVALENIDRIEVTRGPNAAAYGVNAMLATINIITRSPQDTHGGYVRAVAGNDGYQNIYGGVGDRVGNFDWRLSYVARASDGFDQRYTQATRDLVSFEDSYDIDTFDFSSVLELGPRDSLELRTGLTDLDKQVDPEEYDPAYGVSTPPDVSTRHYFFSGKHTHAWTDDHDTSLQVYYHDTDRQQDWISCVPSLLLEEPYLSSGLPQVCGWVNQDIAETRLDVELQDTARLTPWFNLLTGAAYRHDQFESETFLGGKDASHLGRVFANAEIKPVEWLTTNLGGMWERDTNAGDFFSPRAALNIHFDEHQTLRLVYSEAFRTPDALEQSANWTYTVRQPEPALPNGDPVKARLLAVGSGTLREERIVSREVSYLAQYRFSDAVWSSEVKYFDDRLTDLIAGRLGIDNFDLENSVAIDQQGVELETSLDWRADYLRLTYAYIDPDARYTGQNLVAGTASANRILQLESRLTAQHSGSASWIHRFRHNVTSALSVYVVDQLALYEFQRADLRLAKGFQWQRFSFEVAGIVQRYLNDNPIQYPDNILADRTHAYAELSARF